MTTSTYSWLRLYVKYADRSRASSRRFGPERHRYTPADSAASYRFCGSSTWSPEPSRPTASQVLGRNCIGPTARSVAFVPSRRPPSLSGTTAKVFEPSSSGP